MIRLAANMTEAWWTLAMAAQRDVAAVTRAPRLFKQEWLTRAERDHRKALAAAELWSQ